MYCNFQILSDLLDRARIVVLCPVLVEVVEILTDSLCKVLIQTFNIIESDIYEGSSLKKDTKRPFSLSSGN